MSYLTSLKEDEIRRIEETVSCHDADYIPKVPDAGIVRVDHDGNRVQIMHNGVIVSADGYYGEVNTRIVERLKGHHEPQEEKAFYEVLKAIPRRSTMIELGCYWAYYSLWFNKAIEGARNFMIEPNKSALQCGINNFRLNRMSGDFTQATVGSSSSEGWQGDGRKASTRARTSRSGASVSKISFEARRSRKSPSSIRTFKAMSTKCSAAVGI